MKYNEIECDGVSTNHTSPKERSVGYSRIVTVDVDLNVLFMSDSVAALANAILSEIDCGDFRIRFQFLNQPDSFATPLQPFLQFFEKTIMEQHHARCVITLSGPFSRSIQEDRDFFIKNSIHLEYAPLSSDKMAMVSDAPGKIVSEIGGLGFRIPFVWYVNNENVLRISSQIDEAMFLSFNSGLSLPLCCYDLFSSKTMTLPPFDDYLSLLAEVYEKYPFYDEGFAPLDCILVNSLRLLDGKYWQKYYYDSETRQVIQYAQTKLEQRIEMFFTKFFNWNREEMSRQKTQSIESKEP